MSTSFNQRQISLELRELTKMESENFIHPAEVNRTSPDEVTDLPAEHRTTKGNPTANEETTSVFKHNLLFSILDVPPIGQCILLGLQHFITMMSGTAILPTLLFDSLCITELSDRSAVISSTFFVMGIATLLQTLIGTRLPIIQGSSAALLVPAFAILSSDSLPSCPAASGNGSLPAGNSSKAWDNGPPVWMVRISYLGGTLAVSSLFQVIVGATGLTAVMVRFIGPLVIAPTICLIGLSLMSIAAASASKNWAISLLVCLLVILFGYIIDWVRVPLPTIRQRRLRFKGFELFKSFPVLLAVGLAWALCGVLTAVGALADDPAEWSYSSRADVGSRAFAEAAWLRLPYPGQFGAPKILATGILGMIAGIIVSVVESIGDYVAAAKLSGAPRPPSHAINRGVMMEGLACTLTGLFGLPTASTSYSENIGAIGITRVGSRRVVLFSAAFMIFFGLSPKSGALFVSLPEPVIGGLFLTMFGMVAGIGLSNLQSANMNDQRNVFVVGFSLIVGLAVPHWLRTPFNGLCGAPSAANAMLIGKSPAIKIVLQTLLTLLKNEMFVAGFTALLLDSILRGSPSDRGVANLNEVDTSFCRRRRELEFFDLPYGLRLLGRWPPLRHLPFLPDYRGMQATAEHKRDVIDEHSS